MTRDREVVVGRVLVAASLAAIVAAALALRPGFLLGVFVVLAGAVGVHGVRRLSRPRSGTLPIESGCVRRLEKAGKLRSSTHRALRALALEEDVDEGSHYVIELDDGSILYVVGTFLCEYEPCDDPEVPLPRRFPSTEFTVHRHRTRGYVVHLECRGAPIEPEVVLSPRARFEEEELEPIDDSWELFRVPGRSFDAVKSLLAARTSSRAAR